MYLDRCICLMRRPKLVGSRLCGTSNVEDFELYYISYGGHWRCLNKRLMCYILCVIFYNVSRAVWRIERRMIKTWIPKIILRLPMREITTAITKIIINICLAFPTCQTLFYAFTSINSFNSHYNPVKWVLSLSSFYSWGNWMFSDLPKLMADLGFELIQLAPG